MSKKDKMLNYISDNVKWFLSTDSSIEVIPYHKMSNAVLQEQSNIWCLEMLSLRMLFV